MLSQWVWRFGVCFMWVGVAGLVLGFVGVCVASDCGWVPFLCVLFCWLLVVGCLWCISGCDSWLLADVC